MKSLIHWGARKLRARVTRREPDVLIGGAVDTYMKRWWIIPRNPYFNIYLHHFLRSDDDRALHDHPWWNLSYLIEGSYLEQVPLHLDDPAGPRRVHVRHAGQFAWRKATACHRIELFGRPPLPVWTIFITGPKIRDWGFWCGKPKAPKWVPWEQFTSPADVRDEQGRVRVATIGRGCGED